MASHITKYGSPSISLPAYSLFQRGPNKALIGIPAALAFIGLFVTLLSIRLLHVGGEHSHGDGHGHEHNHNMKVMRDD